MVLVNHVLDMIEGETVSPDTLQALTNVAKTYVKLSVYADPLEAPVLLKKSSAPLHDEGKAVLTIMDESAFGFDSDNDDEETAGPDDDDYDELTDADDEDDDFSDEDDEDDELTDDDFEDVDYDDYD